MLTLSRIIFWSGPRPAGCLVGFDRSVLSQRFIAASKIVESDANQISKHSNGIPKVTHRCALAVVPDHRHFEQSQPLLFSDVQHFRIEPESLDALKLEDRKSRFASKRLEAALRILELQVGD